MSTLDQKVDTIAAQIAQVRRAALAFPRCFPSMLPLDACWLTWVFGCQVLEAVNEQARRSDVERIKSLK